MIHLITSFYVLKKKDKISTYRNNELLESLVKNINCDLISKIHLYIDDIEALEEIESIYNFDKIKIISIGKQPLYSDLFEYAIDNLKEEICMIANSDIYLYECDLDCLNRLSNNIFALTRYEHDLSSYFIDNNWGVSHDAFIFKSPLNKNIINSMKHFQNLWGSENSVINSLIDIGNYKIFNPCYQIKIVHLHSSEYRNLDRIRITDPKYEHKPCYY